MRKAFYFRLLLLLVGVILFFHSCVKDRGPLPEPPYSFTYVEGFESSLSLPSGWTLFNPDNDCAWQVVNTAHSTGLNCIGFNNCDGNGTADPTGRKDRFTTHAFDFSKATTVSLSFDVAYAVLNFKGVVYTDSLAVYASTDGGGTWNRIYYDGGYTLTNIPELTTSPPCWAPTSSSDWRTDKTSLNSLAGKSNVLFAFENISGWGEWIFLDNISIVATNQAPCNATFATDVLPIMQTECGKSGCHDGSSQSDLNTYAGVKSRVDNGGIKKRMFDGNGGFMPATGKLPDATLNKVKCWMDNGALNN